MYQLFGSGDSRDTDIVFFVQAMPATTADKLALVYYDDFQGCALRQAFYRMP